MARCLLCNKSGWFLKTSGDGLCETCERNFDVEVSSLLGVINESLDIATKTKRLGTMLSRFVVAEDACRQLLKYERHGVPTTDPPPGEFIEGISSERRIGVLEWIDRELSAARAKSGAATTPAGKTRGYSKLLENINSIYAEIDDPAEVAEAEMEVRRELDSVRLKVEIDRAAKLAFKGQRKRACEAYLDALYLLRGDSVPDVEQQGEIDDIESKIRELGGELPAVR